MGSAGRGEAAAGFGKEAGLGTVFGGDGPAGLAATASPTAAIDWIGGLSGFGDGCLIRLATGVSVCAAAG